MEAITNIEIDLISRRPCGPWVYAVQGDGNTRRVSITLLSNGRPWNVPEGAEAAVEYRQPGGTKGLYNLLPDGTAAVRTQGNRVTIVLAAPMLSKPGDVRAAIVFNNKSLDQLTTFPFTITVQSNPSDCGQEVEDYVRLQWLESKLDDYLKRAKDSGVFDGPKGEAFTYDDFTPEQLAALTGPQGPAGDNSAAVQAAEAANAAAASANTAAAAANEAASAAKAVVDTVVTDVTQLKNDLAVHGEALDNRIKKFYTGNLGAVSIADSDDGAVRNLVIGGRCLQQITNGYQLLDESDFYAKAIANNATIVNRGADSLTFLTKTGDSSPGVFLTNVIPSIEESYMVSAEITSTADYTGAVRLGSTNMTINNVALQANVPAVLSAIATPATASIAVYLVGMEPVDAEITISKLMLAKADTVVAYEPYTGGIPSPSPDYPQEIKSVENCTITASSTDGTKTQEAVIPFTLRGIGNVRDELYVYGDGTGKLVQWYPNTLDPTKTVAEQALTEPIVTPLASETVKALFDLQTYYGGTSVTYQSENGVEPVVNFDYACALGNFVEYIKTAQGDDRKFIYDMDERMTDVEYVTALAYVNSEYAAAITELEV